MSLKVAAAVVYSVQLSEAEASCLKMGEKTAKEQHQYYNYDSDFITVDDMPDLLDISDEKVTKTRKMPFWADGLQCSLTSCFCKTRKKCLGVERQ